MTRSTVPISLTMRNDGQLEDENGTIVYASVAEVRQAYDLSQADVLVWPVGHTIRFPR